MSAHYGYIRGKDHIGADGDHIDVYLGPHIKSEKVYVINQVDYDTKHFDEIKTMIGFGSLQQALSTYEKAFSDGKGLLRIGSIVATTMPKFKEWLQNGNTKKPYVEMKEAA